MKQFSKLLPTLFCSGLILCASPSSAEPQFEKIHKDITVMANIMKGAFEAEEDCRGCDPKIDSNYLADQGVVFTVRASSRGNFHFGSDHHSSYSFVIPSPEEVRHVEITEVVEDALGGVMNPEVVEDVLDNIGEVMDDVGNRIELRLGELESDTVIRLSSETRRSLREVNRKRRELEYQRREHEIELIHADDKEQKRIEKRISDLDSRIAELEKSTEKLNETYEAERAKREQERTVKREKAKQQAEQHLALVENTVLRSLCDYGATLKNIPSNEHVSVLFEQRNSDVTQVFVMDLADVMGCRDAEVLRSDATTYRY